MITTLCRFGIGLSTELNDSDPTSFKKDHPLSSYQNMYWNMLKYRFVKFEGRANLSGSLQKGNDFLLAYHTGTDPLYTVVSLPGNYSLNPEDNNTIKVNIELDELFASSQNPIDFETEAQTHSTSADIPVAKKFTTNLTRAFLSNLI